LFLFDAKKKEPFGGGEPRHDGAAGQKNNLFVNHIDFYAIDYPSG
jgi:hypothetical protein